MGEGEEEEVETTAVEVFLNVFVARFGVFFDVFLVVLEADFGICWVCFLLLLLLVSFALLEL